ILGGTTNSDESNGVEADVSNMETTITASPTPTLKIHKDHPKSQIIGLVDTSIQTKNKSKEVGEQSFIATIHQKTDPALLQFCLFSCFLSQVEPKKISDALQDPIWNKKDERGIVIRNKARLVAQGHTREEGIDYDKVFAPVARIEAIRLFLAYASFMVFIVYQMDVKSVFLYGTIDEEVYVMQPPGFQDPKFPARVYKVEKAMYGLHQAPRAWYGTLSKYLLTNGFQRGTIDQTLFIKRQRGDFILIQVYVNDIIFGSLNPQLCKEFEVLMHEKFQMSAMGDILKKFGYSDVRSSNTPMDKENPWGKDRTGKDVDLHLYRSMIGSLMYLTASRPDIMFVVCACARHPVTPKECHLHAVKRIFRYLKGHPKLELWYPKESPFHLVAYSDSEYGGTSKYWDVLRILMISLRLILLSTARIETTEEGTKILATVDDILRTITQSSLRRNHKLQDEEGISSLPDTKLFENLTLMGYNISPNQKFTFQKPSVLPPVADEPASPLRDVSQGEACPTDSGFIADQDRATIAKSSTLPYDSAPRVTSHAADEGTQEVEINRLKARVKLLKDREGVAAERSRDDAPIKGRNLDEGEAAAERVSDDTEEMATVLTSMDAATVLASGVAGVPTGSGSIPTASPPAAEFPTGSDVVPTASPIFATATVVTPYRRRKGKEVMVESETPKKQKVQEQIDAQVARELEEQLEREDQRMSEQIARDVEVARIHVEEELQSMIDGLDRNNETVVKYLQEYQQFASELPLERRIELISDLVRYQDNYGKVYKFQTQQRKPWSKKQKRDYYMVVNRSNLGWKVKDFRGMSFEEIKAKFTTVWKQLHDFVPIGSKEEAEMFKRKGTRFEQESTKKLKTSEEVPEEVKSPDEVPEEKVKQMMQLVPIEEVYVEALQVKHPIIDWKVHTEGQRSYWKIIRLGGSSAFVDLLKHMDREDLNHLWDLVKESLSNRQPTIEWKFYDMCGVHQVTSKDKEIFMLVEKDYPLRKGLALLMICYKLQVENYSQMANDLILKIYKIANSPKTARNKMHKAFPLSAIEFPLAEEVPTASEESSHCQKKRDATAKRIVLLVKSRNNYLQRLNSAESLLFHKEKGQSRLEVVLDLGGSFSSFSKCFLNSPHLEWSFINLLQNIHTILFNPTIQSNTLLPGCKVSPIKHRWSGIGTGTLDVF
nr:hypothetical protein [Tanacetum cinerariifolium]